VPKEWRKANVTCLVKKGKKEDPGNYRFVILTSIHGKVMEQLILETICRHIQDEKIIRSSQHGFTKGKSRLTNLINFYDGVTGVVHEGRAVAIVCLDFSKAFDTVSQKILIDKLFIYGLDKQTARWVENQLNGQVQRVVTRAAKSSWRPMTSGLVWGPVLFNFSINDLDDKAEHTLSTFADDTELGGVADTPEGRAAIQKDLDRLEKLADRKFMKFNKTKCKVLHLRENNLMLVATQLDVSLAEKALRVLLDTKMSMNQQCALG